MRFEIPGRLPSLNDHIRECNKNYRAGNRLKKETQDVVIWAIKAAHLREAESPIYIRFTWVEPNMKRDKDNIAFAKKYILDALQITGIIPNDGWKDVLGFSDQFLVNKDNPRVIVDIEEVSEWNLVQYRSPQF